jgi:NADP-dependent 3-hydroxy acid dehydrogenase YdfG
MTSTLCTLAHLIPYCWTRGIADELLRQGYKVHGATRDSNKAQPLADKFQKLYGEDAFTVVEIKELTTTENWIQALQGGF